MLLCPFEQRTGKRLSFFHYHKLSNIFPYYSLVRLAFHPFDKAYAHLLFMEEFQRSVARSGPALDTNTQIRRSELKRYKQQQFKNIFIIIRVGYGSPSISSIEIVVLDEIYAL